VTFDDGSVLEYHNKTEVFKGAGVYGMHVQLPDV
jgi:hypothetical protein